MAKIKSRKVKIYSKFRSRRRDNTTVPEIRLQGKWLDEFGFYEGHQVKVHLEYNKLTITKIENDKINT